jgi:hypothetical protein
MAHVVLLIRQPLFREKQKKLKRAENIGKYNLHN